MDLTVLWGSANPALASAISGALGLPTQPVAELRRFEDGELHVRLLTPIRGRDVYIVQPTSPPVDEHIMELLFLADACRQAGSARLTAVVPYFGYARQDRRAAGREAVGARVAAGLIEGAGFARVMAVDLHAPEIEGFFRIPVEHLSAATLLVQAVRAEGLGVIVAPDLGAVKLAERYQARLDLPVALVHKRRVSGSEVALRGVLGDVRDRAPLVVDDMITTGGTIEAAVNGLLQAGCRPDISVAATHALFVGRAAARLRRLPVRQLLGTNSVAASADLPRLEVVNLAPMLSDAIGRLHRDESIDDLRARG